MICILVCIICYITINKVGSMLVAKLRLLLLFIVFENVFVVLTKNARDCY